MKNKSILLIGNHLSTSSQNPSIGEGLALKLNGQGWSVNSTSNKLNKATRFADMLSTVLLKRNNFQVALVDVFSGSAFIWAYCCGWLLKLLKKPFILILHGGNLPQFSKQYSKRIQQLLNWAMVVISPSAYLAHQLKSFRGDIQIIPNPIQIDRYGFIYRQKPAPSLVWLRAFHEIYNPSLVPKVLSLLKNEFPQLKITMVGPDKGDGSLQRMCSLAEKLNVQNHIKIISGVPNSQVADILTKSDIFLNTTNFDNTPVSVIEAMASGLCIVSTKVGGIPYLLENEIDSLLVPPNDPPTMVAAIQRTLNECGLAGRLSTNARKKAESLDWSIILPQWEEIINKTINNEQFVQD